MAADLIHLGIVTSSLILLVVVPFLPVSYLLFRGQQWPKIVLSAMVIGASLQASAGLLWSHLVVRWPLYELAALGAGWLLLLLWSMRRAAHQRIVVCDPDSEPVQPALILILCAAFAIRSIHPLEVAYLGQSDAYTHLNYIHNVIASGYLINPVYPPGYHWIMALPSLVFSIDPYLIARFGGAFFGTGLVLGVYVLLDQCVSRSSAIFASFCAAAFPGMTLLMKTGVGVFANQFGLFLLPAIALFYILSLTDSKRNASDRPVLLIALCGMAAAVPMMLLHVLLVIGLERLAMLVRYRRKWLVKTTRTGLLILPALCLFAYHLSQVGAGNRYGTAEIMTGYGESAAEAAVVKKVAERIERQVVAHAPQQKKRVELISSSPYFKLVLDYLSLKRRGFGNFKLDVLGAALAGLFLVLLIAGMLRRTSAFMVIGIWGLLTSVQAGTGLFQFSSYQREGWSLLVATCCLSGIVAASVYDFGQRSLMFRIGVAGLMTACTIWSLMHPPIHFPIRSSAEHELIRVLRFIGAGSAGDRSTCGSADDVVCSLQEHLAEGLDTVLVTRRFVGWGNQGEIAKNVLPPDTVAEILIVDGKKDTEIFQPGRQYVVLIDELTDLSGRHMLGAFAMVTPSMVRETLKSRERLFRLNGLVLQQIDRLSASRWQVERFIVSENLTAYLVIPADAT